MEVERRKIWEMFDRNYCPRCGKITSMTKLNSCLQGIAHKRCHVCQTRLSANFIEDESDLVEVPDDFIIQ